MISFQIKPSVAFGLPYLLTELFYIGMPVVRTDGRSLARRTVTWLPNFVGWVDYHISLAMGLCPRARFARGWSSAIRARGLDCLSGTELAYRRYSLHGHLFTLYGTVLFAPKTPKFIHNSFLYNAVISVLRTPASNPLVSVLRRSDCIYFYFIDFTEKVHDKENFQQEPTQSVVRIATWFEHLLWSSLASLISLRLKSSVNFQPMWTL